VLLHKVPEKKTARRGFRKFSAHCKFSAYRLA